MNIGIAVMGEINLWLFKIEYFFAELFEADWIIWFVGTRSTTWRYNQEDLTAIITHNKFKFLFNFYTLTIFCWLPFRHFINCVR